jgi:5-methylcytosine-specific restriction endonuclease McrA
MGFLDKLLGLNKEERTESSKTEKIPTGYNYKLLHEKQNPLWPGPSQQQIEGLKYVGKTKFSVPLGDCVCGCNGEPMTYFDEWELDYYAYKDCPARRRRKLKAKLARKEKRRKETEKRQAERKAEKEEAKQKKINNRLKLWEQREETGQPAKTRKEAIHRGLTTYMGNKCKRGHDGKRLTKNGECSECNASDKLQRFAMRKAEFPENLSQEERDAVISIYNESKRLTKETGVQHHVDHIKPLAKGGRHHPSNLQILTAEENLKKSDKWEE